MQLHLIVVERGTVMQEDGSFIELLGPHYDDALNYCRALCAGDEGQQAEDVAQQALLRAYEHFDGLRDRSKFRSWFFTIITNEYRTERRRKQWRSFIPLRDDHGSPEHPKFFGNDGDEMNARLYKALAILNTRERSALLLFELGGFSIQEIATMQNEKSISAVKSRLSRSRTRLREKILSLEQASNERTKKAGHEKHRT